MKDIQSTPDTRGIAIDQVGVCDLLYPITVLDRENQKQQCAAKVSLSVSLPHHFKGTHMSRFLQVLAEQVDDWASRCSDKSLLFNQWIRGKEGHSKAEEIFGSLGVDSPKSKASSKDLQRQHGYLHMRAVAILWARGSGTSWNDISRRWKIDPEEIGEEEWIRSRSHLLSGFAEICDIRCFFYHLKEDCKADDAKIQKAKNTLRRLRAGCFKTLGRLKYCSPLGPLLVAMKLAGTKGVGVATIEKLEASGITSAKEILEMPEEKIRELGIDAKKWSSIRSYLRRN